MPSASTAATAAAAVGCRITQWPVSKTTSGMTGGPAWRASLVQHPCDRLLRCKAAIASPASAVKSHTDAAEPQQADHTLDADAAAGMGRLVPRGVPAQLGAQLAQPLVDLAGGRGDG